MFFFVISSFYLNSQGISQGADAFALLSKQLPGKLFSQIYAPLGRGTIELRKSYAPIVCTVLVFVQLRLSPERNSFLTFFYSW